MVVVDGGAAEREDPAGNGDEGRVGEAREEEVQEEWDVKVAR